MKRSLFIALYLFGCLLLTEAAMRLALKIIYNAPFFQPAQLIYSYYPQLLPIKQASISNSDSTLDVLVLSCSVLHPEWGDFGGLLEKKWQPSGPYRSIKIYNASGIGHSSLDNLIKRKLLAEKTFDRVIYYDAINDARLNNCPAEVFKTDYSHYQWYDEINTILRHPEMNVTVIPFIADRVISRLRHAVNKQDYIAVHYSMQPEWMEQGGHFKNLSAYKNNFTHLLELVAQHGEPITVVPFVYYHPEGYTLEKFRSQQTDFTFHKNSRETEIWGKPEHVSRFIEAINDSCLVWIKPYANVNSLSMSAFPEEKAYFADICHFSPAGMDTFAALVTKELSPSPAPAGH